MKARIMTFNTQHCAAFLDGLRIDLPLFGRTVAESGADIVALNEMRNIGPREGYTDQTGMLARLAKMKEALFSEAIRFEGILPYGNSLISKLAVREWETVMIPDPNPRGYSGYYETRAILKAELESGLRVLVTHVGLNPDEQENAISTLKPLLRREKCILMGDFNMEPDNPLIAEISREICDTGSMIEGDSRTFPSDLPTRKIDYIFLSPDIRVKRVFVPELIVSDHRPIVADIEW